MPFEGCPLVGAVLAAGAWGGSGTNPVAPPSAVAPPQIRSIQVVPPTVPLGGTAQINVAAVDPAGGPVVCRFVAQAGKVSIPDSGRAPCAGLYENDGSQRGSDTVTVTATNSANLSTVSSASLALTERPSSGNPTPTPSPVPTPTPAPVPTPTPSGTVPPPVVTTQPATSVTTASATLNGTVDGRGAPATYHFDYGSSPGYGSSTAEQNVPSGASAVAVSQSVSGLMCGASYHHRVVGTNAGGQTAGADRAFSTAPCPPTVAVTSSGDCHPTCTATFTATTTNAGVRLRDGQPGHVSPPLSGDRHRDGNGDGPGRHRAGVGKCEGNQRHADRDVSRQLLLPSRERRADPLRRE